MRLPTEPHCPLLVFPEILADLPLQVWESFSCAPTACEMFLFQRTHVLELPVYFSAVPTRLQVLCKIMCVMFIFKPRDVGTWQTLNKYWREAGREVMLWIYLNYSLGDSVLPVNVGTEILLALV